MTDWGRKKPSEQIPKRGVPDPQGEGSAYRRARAHPWFDTGLTHEDNEVACRHWRAGEIAAGRGRYNEQGFFVHDDEGPIRSASTEIEL